MIRINTLNQGTHIYEQNHFVIHLIVNLTFNGRIYIYIFFYECTPFYFYYFGVTPSHGAVVTSTDGGINSCDPFYMVLKGVPVGVALMAHCGCFKGLELDSPL